VSWGLAAAGVAVAGGVDERGVRAGQRLPCGDEVPDAVGLGGFVDLRRRLAELGRPDLLAASPLLAIAPRISGPDQTMYRSFLLKVNKARLRLNVQRTMQARLTWIVAWSEPGSPA
jgi:hypothetical protein